MFVSTALGRLLLATSLGLLGLVLSACQPPPATQLSPVAGGGIVAEQGQVDLGQVPFNRQVVAHFILVNAGATEVHLDNNVDVQTLEGC
jgi:hypothetical protein